MNIRNLLFTSMIFCVAPIMYAAQDVSLTKQEQEKIRQWAELIINTCPLKGQKLINVQKAIYTYICAQKDLFISSLSKMQAGESVKTSPVVEVIQLYERQIYDLFAKLDTHECKYVLLSLKVFGQICSSMIAQSDELFSTKTEVIKEQHIVAIKKMLAINLFTLECLSSLEDLSIQPEQDQDTKKDSQSGSMWTTLSHNPIKTVLGVLCLGATGYGLYTLYAR